MNEARLVQLKQVIESQHGGTATLIGAVRVMETGAKPGVWDGLVHVFDLRDHPRATRAYAWSSPIQGGTQDRFFAVLHEGRVTGPVQAVKAAVGAIRKWSTAKAT